MLSNKKLLSINELKVGMISASDIQFEGKVLLGKGVAITESAIEALTQNYIVDKVSIYTDAENTVKSIKKNTLKIKTRTIKDIETSFNEFSSNLENIFRNISKLKLNGMEGLREFSNKIQNGFNSTDLIIRDVLINGSKDDAIYKHSINVSALSFILGKWLGLNENEINLLTYTAILHDFGKTKIDNKIINKKGPLNYDENKIYKTHTVLGYDLVKQIPYLDNSVSYGVLMHHERLDGSGFPFQITDEKIHKFAKIIAVADIFDNVTSNRYHEKIKNPFEPLKIIKEESLSKLDKRYCDMFLNHVINYFMGENVVLNDNRICKIVKLSTNDLLNPTLLYNDSLLDLKEEKNLYVKKIID